MTDRPGDWAARHKAIDISCSCIVQAPAGSGKTELLTQRLLALLAQAKKPEEILAITFTRKAAGEMKARLLEALDAADLPTAPMATHARETWELARLVLEADQRNGWHLRENPARLQLLTIDSLCAHLTRRMPWLARFGDQPTVTDQPAELYRQATEHLLTDIEETSAVAASMRCLLEHLDNRMSVLRDLLVSMLGRRDQWIRHVLQQRTDEARRLLEKGLQAYIQKELEQTHDLLGVDFCRELVELGVYAAENLDDHGASPLAALAGRTSLDAAVADFDAWLAIAHLTLTAQGDLRKSVDKRLGFPAAKAGPAFEMKQRMKDCLEALQTNPQAVAALCELRHLPAAIYTEEQWTVLDALIELLPAVVVELQQVFRTQGAVDFIEIAGAAQAALGHVQQPEDLLLQLDSTLRHILVDEFQDTSFTQYTLLEKLTAGWSPGDGRTLFIVGDPMQSIYRFREADVGLFLRVCEQGLNSLPMERLCLSANFRSQAHLVDWANDFFRELFPVREDQLRGAVRFAPATAVHPPLDGGAVTFTCFENRQDRAEAEQVLELVQQAKRRRPDGSIAVLVRSRHHLTEIVRTLKGAGLIFQAQDIDSLAQRSVVQDLLALTRALLLPADRVAWLSVLRAPWCGLTLADLHALCGQQSPDLTLYELLVGNIPQIEMFDVVSEEGRQRIARVLPVLQSAMALRGRLPLRQLVESAWLSLGGPACIDEAGLLDVEQVFTLLETQDEGGDLSSLPEFEEGLARLFAAPDPLADASLQLMTIHKAKGLEFDTVIVPGMGRGVKGNERSLLRWLEHPDLELLLAPIPASCEDREDQTYQALGRIMKERADLETLRLIYVAVTRARERLHLLGHVRRNTAGDLRPEKGSFFGETWVVSAEPAARQLFGVDEQNEVVSAPALLTRLPHDWSLPTFADAVRPGVEASKRASDTGHYRTGEVRTMRTEEGRVVGTLVHAWLQKISESGVDSWDRSRLESQCSTMVAQCFRNGLSLSQHKRCLTKIIQCLVTTIEDSRGRWLLSDHAEAACELALNGMVAGELVRASIDRTFLDAGVRWVVDYKTSQPTDGATPEAFMAREAARYSAQMMTYRSLLQAFDHEHPVRTALYFPMLGSWYELKPEQEDLPG